MTNTPTPPPRLVPDRPSDAAIAQAFYAYTNGWRATDSLDHRLEIIQKAREIDAEYGVQPTLTEQLQMKCSVWGTYWRAPDAHGVILNREQALELLRDALGVEVEIDAAAPPAEAPAERLLHTGWGADEWKSLPLTRRLEVHSGDCAKAADESGDAVMLANQLCALHDDILEALAQLAPAPAAPAEGDDYSAGIAFIVRNKENLLKLCAGPSEQFVVERTLDILSAPRVTGGREWDDAAVERAARFICVTVGEDWDSIGDFARSVLIENQRAALQAATGGAVES